MCILLIVGSCSEKDFIQNQTIVEISDVNSNVDLKT
jgi:hypothetical protein